MLIDHPNGEYRFLKGIAPYSCGVVATPGHEIIHATLKHPMDWREGFQGIANYLSEMGLQKSSLCAVQLRCPAPYPMHGFIDFNEDYLEVLRSWKLYVGDLNPIARTNVAPLNSPPIAPQLYAFSFVTKTRMTRPTFIVAGAGELRDGILDQAGIIRAGETSEDGMLEKATYVIQVMTERMQGLSCGWADVNRTNLYSCHPVHQALQKAVLPAMGPAALHGVNVFATRPPVVDIEFEMDVRGVCQERTIVSLGKP